MKLVQLYSNDQRFKPVRFSPGFNIILGQITDSSNMNKDCHNLGKTTLIDLIDFMLLKQLSKDNFLKQSEFSHHTFFLEVELNLQSYLTIKRSISKNTKISLKLSKTRDNNYCHELEWDYEDLALTTKTVEKNPKYILNNLLGFNILPNYFYRDFLNYFLRTQNDYNDEFHLSKYAGTDANWKPQVFELLGFDATPIIKKYKLDSEYEKLKENIEKIKKENKIDPSEIDKIKGLIQIKELEKFQLEDSLSKLNFYMDEKKLNKELVDDLENSIAILNKKRYNLNLELKSLQDSLNNKFSFDLDSTLIVFKEANIYFPNQLKKSYGDLIEFNKTLTDDRNKYIKSTTELKKQQLKDIDSNLVSLNEKKELLLGVLIESDLFKKYKSFEQELIHIERDIEKLSIKLDSLSIIDKENEKLNNLKNDIEDLKKEIKLEVESANEKNALYFSIRKKFTDFVKYVIDKYGLISIKPNGAGNVDFKAEILSDTNEITAQDRGHTYKKILCACFDLAILINYSNRSFFKFIYHDGVLESLDPRKQIKYLNLVSNLCVKHDIQYILTSIESDIPLIDSENKDEAFFINPCNIAVKLSDEDDTTNLFGFTF